jgi:hypothetical protein
MYTGVERKPKGARVSWGKGVISISLLFYGDLGDFKYISGL